MISMPKIQAELTDEQLRILTELARQRGVDANTVLQQAISTEDLLARNVGDGDDVIIKRKDKSLAKVVFDNR
jgi:hypothetical protein